MKNTIFNIIKYLYYSSLIVLIILYLYPGSLIGYFLYGDFKLQPPIPRDYIISSNHLYAFGILSSSGILTYKNTKKIRYVSGYLIAVSTFLEIFHNFIPERSFEYSDLFGNLAGVIIVIIIFNLLKIYENSKN